MSDKEHAEMIRLYVEEGLSLEKIAEKFNRSSRTPLLHIRKHDQSVERSVFVLCVEEAEACGKQKG